MGFEPILRKSKSRVLTICTTPYQLVGRMGFEPMTARLSDGNSYQLNYLPMKWEEQDSNLYRMELQPIALPLELSSQKENHLPLSDKWFQNKELLLAAHILSNPHDLIKTSQIIQFLLMHQNWSLFCIILNSLIIVDNIVFLLIINLWVAGTGLEPATSGLWARLSSIW